ncbi:MAG: ChbG/HpnK family deacetylase [Burkholderiaceae bacterium]|jgi:predicted glycoside hydrolase/deacetylase ChbG (UPF0249 family)|nr:ChbG/HpnK family deacetylase [Burkholderiaceae bacterium]
MGIDTGQARSTDGAQDRPLILCADDYAAGAAVSRGIAELARSGRVTATSAMTLSPRWPQDAAALRELRGRIDVGLHLDWTSPFAVAAGHGATLPRIMLRAALGGIDRQYARSVIERQLDTFEAAWQAPPDHVDGHQHVQQFAGIRAALLDALAQRYPQRKPWLRISRLGAGQGGLKGRVIGALGAAALARQAAQADWPCAPELWGVYDFAGGPARYATLMDGWLSRAPAHAVLMCHPGQGAADGDDPIAAARQWEFDVLGSPAFAQALARHGIRLARGSSTESLFRSHGSQVARSAVDD